MSNDRETADRTSAPLEQSVKPTNGSTPVHRTIDDRSPSITVVEAIAAAQGVSPLEVSGNLCDAINPDALNQLFELTDGTVQSGRVVFTKSGYEITVTARGDVYVHDA